MDHASLAYGADWCDLLIQDLPVISPRADAEQTESLTESTNKSQFRNGCLIASCSFYDHAMHTWAVNI